MRLLRKSNLSRAERKLLKTARRLVAEAEILESLLMLHDIERARLLDLGPISPQLQRSLDRVNCESRERVERLRRQHRRLMMAVNENDSR